VSAPLDPNSASTEMRTAVGSGPPGTPAHELPTLTSLTAAGDATFTLQRMFGDYELLEELGRGGMGVVFKARQVQLDRVVALKMILSSHLANAADLQRFHIEAAAAARLQHPNIVSVHEVGVVEGQHFYSMEFIAGPSLSKRLSDGPLPGKLAARYVMLIARAIHYAHIHGILHRDLKPSNILLDADDQPHVTDFGLAKKLGTDSTQTQTGAILGTPSYMAPEQAAGKVKELTSAVDIYGLGAVLYELLTGRPVFHAGSTLDTVRLVLEEEPVAPRQLNPRVDQDLETICLKCLQKDPRNRYATAEALADDLQRYLNADPISARSFSMIDRIARTLERDQYAIEFRGWAKMLLWFAVIMLAGHLAMFLLVEFHQPRSLHWLARTVQLVAVGITFWHFRLRHGFLPASAAERQLWTIWIGYLLAYMIIVAVVRQMAGAERWDDLTLYPFSAVLSGMGFFAMGSSYWGRFYLFGLAFFALAALMPLMLTLAPLGLGVLWSAALVIIARHVRSLEDR
jgi:tRNA A-37 threonylcarbamoyl transferase component Bud32